MTTIAVDTSTIDITTRIDQEMDPDTRGHARRTAIVARELAIPFAVKHGFPASWFIAFPNESHSTDEEARAIWPELRKRNVHRVLVVTSDYHTRRALHTLRARWPGINICMVAAPDEFFSAYGWWHTREGRKTFFLECSKTLVSMVGM